MPPKKSNVNNARNREAQRKRVERVHQSPEQISARIAAQRIRTAEGRAQESQEERDERVRQNIARTRAAREQNIAAARVQERQRPQTSRLRATFSRLSSEYAPDINYSAHSTISIGATDEMAFLDVDEETSEVAQDFGILLYAESDLGEDDPEYIGNVENKRAMTPDEAVLIEDTSVTLIGIYDEYGNEIPMNKNTSTCLPPEHQERRPAKRPSTSLVPSESLQRPRGSNECNVVVSIEKIEEPSNDSDGNDSITTEEVFHLADEHELFQGEGGETRPALGGRRSRGRGCERGHKQKTDDARWVTGDKLIHINVHDDDVPEELRKLVMQVVAAREARRREKDRAEKSFSLHEEELDEEYVDADDGQDEALFAGGEHSSHFEWCSMDTYVGKRETFLPQRTGPVVASDNAYAAFRQFWDDEIMSHIVDSTNRNAAKISGSFVQFARDWYDTNIHELFVLFTFWMMLGVIKMPTTKSCFTTNPLLQTNIFREMFSKTRYQYLCKALDFSHRPDRPNDKNNHLHCLEPILDHLNSRFKSAYIPSQNIRVDESLTMWKGDLSFHEYIKTYELCESSTGYLWSFIVNLDGSTAYDASLPSNLPKSTATALTLVRPLLNKGYTLFMDSWFSSPLLARYLKTRKTDCVGTLRTNHRDVPPLVSVCRLKDGQFVARHAGDVTVLAYGDKKRKATTVSTFHGISQALTEPKPHRPVQYKPRVVLDYNKSMVGVDRDDQTLEPYLPKKKSCEKWSIKFFKRLLNCSILNSRVIVQASTRASKENFVFRMELVDQILKEHLKHVKNVKPFSNNDSSKYFRTRLSDNKHWPQQITNTLDTGRIARRRCVWCSEHYKKDRRTTYLCSECEVPLCVEPCFMLYHTTRK